MESLLFTKELLQSDLIPLARSQLAWSSCYRDLGPGRFRRRSATMILVVEPISMVSWRIAPVAPEAVKKLNRAILAPYGSESTAENARVGPLSPCAHFLPGKADLQFFHSSPRRKSL
jgi:hypothetical protein